MNERASSSKSTQVLISELNGNLRHGKKDRALPLEFEHVNRVKFDQVAYAIHMAPQGFNYIGPSHLKAHESLVDWVSGHAGKSKLDRLCDVPCAVSFWLEKNWGRTEVSRTEIILKYLIDSMPRSY